MSEQSGAFSLYDLACLVALPAALGVIKEFTLPLGIDALYALACFERASVFLCPAAVVGPVLLTPRFFSLVRGRGGRCRFTGPTCSCFWHRSRRRSRCLASRTAGCTMGGWGGGHEGQRGLNGPRQDVFVCGATRRWAVAVLRAPIRIAPLPLAVTQQRDAGGSHQDTSLQNMSLHLVDRSGQE